MTSSRRRVVLIGAGVLALGAAGLVVRQRATRTDPPKLAGKAAVRAEPDLRAALPRWAQDPDADPGVVAGTVRGPDRAPVAGAVVALFPALETATAQLTWRPAATGRSGADGRFRLVSVRPGEYGITATADGLLGAHQAGLSVLPGATLEGIELLLERGGVTLQGQISDAGGGPIPGAELRVLAGLSGRKQTQTFQVLADGNGKYRVTLAKANYTVVADADGYAPSTRLVDTSVTLTADFALSPAARLAGRVVEKGGRAPVAGASVRLEQFQIWWRSPREVVSTADGRFELRDLDPGSYHVSAHKGTLVSAPAPVEVAAVDRAAEVLVELAAGQSIAGRTLQAGAGAAPVAGARIRLGRGPFGVGGRIRTTSGADGSFRIEGVLPDRYVVSAEHAGHATATREVVLGSAGDLKDIDLVLAPEAVVDGTVVSADGAPVSGATVTGWVVESSAGVSNPGRWASDRTDARGLFRLGALASGQLRIEAQQPDQGRASHGPEPIAAGEQKTVKLTLQAGATVSGKVRWTDGQPAAGVHVMGIVPSGMGMVQARTGPDGAYQLGPLPPGDAMLTASRTGGLAAFAEPEPKASRRLRVEGNEQKRGVDLTLEKGGHRLSGIVLGPDGKPLAGASVVADRGQSPMRAMRAAFAGMLGEKPTLSGEDGRFVIEDLAAGPYTVTAQSAGLPSVTVAKVPTDARDVRLQFAGPAVLAGQAVDPTGKPIPDFTVAAIESEGPSEDPEKKAGRAMRRMASTMGGGGAPPVHDPSGAFQVGGLAAGTYDLLVSTQDGKIGRLTGVAVAAGERKTGLRVTVKQGTSLRGKVVEFPAGKPLPGTLVMVMGEQQPIMRTAGPDGTFSVDGLAAGREVNLVYGGPMTGFIQDRRPVKIPAETPVVDVGRIKLLRGDASPRSGLKALGLRVEAEGGSPEISEVLRGSAAEGAGIKAGERIAAVDGHPVDGLGENSLDHLLEKGPGAAVEITVQSPGAGGLRKVPLRAAAAPQDPDE